MKERGLYWEIYRNNRKEEEEWRLKSRNLWIQDGDKNIAFFHNTTKTRRIINQIDTIKCEGGKDIKGQDAVKKEAHNHFKNLLIADPINPYFESFIKHIPKRIDE